MSNQSAPTDVASAAKNLEQRLDILKIPTRLVTDDEWQKLVPDVAALVPIWLRELLSTYRLIGGVLEYREKSEPWVRLFSFFDVDGFLVALARESLTRNLWDYGYLPIANESDGSVWVTNLKDTAGEVFLLELSAWNGAMPTKDNGLRFAASRLAYLLVSMAVSEASYYASRDIPKSVMWYR